MGCCSIPGASEVLIISSGGSGGSRNPKIVTNGLGCNWCCLYKVDRLSLETITLNLKCTDVNTSQKVPVTVSGMAVVKVNSKPESLKRACKEFLGITQDEKQNIISQILEKELSKLIGKGTVEDVDQNRLGFCLEFREAVQPDLELIGVDIISFSVTNISDNVDYLNSIGRAQVEAVKQKADAITAEFKKQTEIEIAKILKIETIDLQNS